MKGSWSSSVASASLSSGAWWGVLSVKISPLPHHCVPPAGVNLDVSSGGSETSNTVLLLIPKHA